MKRCPECRRDYYDDSLSFCLDDGTRLLEGPGSSEPATKILPQLDTPTRPRVDVAHGYLPDERTRFIGRIKELEECRALLRRSRMLTVTGFGGGGKTRLACRLARDVICEFPDGAWFVDLATVTTEDAVLPFTGKVLGAREEAGTDLLDALLAHIASSRMMIVFDNCEHLLESTRSLADRLLARCPNVSILATSREPLNMQGETVYLLQTLSVNGSDASMSESVELFVDRASAAQPGFQLTGENRESVFEICRKLDGIPLAIELAAARLKVLSSHQIRDMLSERFRLLATSAATVVARHQTLSATMEWSYDPLPNDEKRLLWALSVFAGGCDLTLVTAVFGETDEFEVLERLTRLVDKSLVVVQSSSGTNKRYTLLDTVRQFAFGKLGEHGETDVYRSAHFAAMLGMAELAYRERIKHEEKWSNALEIEAANFGLALEYSRDNDVEMYLTLAGALGWFWLARTHISEGNHHLNAALAATEGGANPVRARALWSAGNMLAWKGDASQARMLMDEALDIWRALGDSADMALALEGVGWTQFFSGDNEEALFSFEECLRIHRAEGDASLINRAMVGLVQVLVALGRIDDAEQMIETILTFSRNNNDKRSEHFGLHFAADCALIRENFAQSLGLYRQSLALANELGDRVETSFEIQGVAMSLAGLGLSKNALALGGAVVAEMHRLGADIHVVFWDALINKYLEKARKDLPLDEAEAAWNEGLALEFDDAVKLAQTLSAADRSPAAP